MFVRSVWTEFDGREPYFCHVAENYIDVGTANLFEDCAAARRHNLFCVRALETVEQGMNRGRH